MTNYVDCVVIAHPGGFPLDLLKTFKVGVHVINNNKLNPTTGFPEGSLVLGLRRRFAKIHFATIISHLRIDDMSFGPAKQQEAEALLAARTGQPDAVEYEFVQYKGEEAWSCAGNYKSMVLFVLGTAHGFATRPNLNLPEVKEGYEKSIEQTVNWFTKHLT